MNLDIYLAEDDTPLWMQQARQGIDWGIVFVVLLSLVVGWSFIIQSEMPLTYDGSAHLFRIADYAEALREGRLYPRWSPHVLYGYGAPVSHYYPPAAAYIPALVEVLFTNDTVSAARLVYMGAIFMAGGMTYYFVSRHSHSTIGFFAALLYLFSPYVGLSVPQILGDLPLLISLAFIPALLWACARLITINGALDKFFVCVFFALLILTDWRGLIGGGAILAVYLLWQAVENGWQVLRRIITPLVLGLLLSSFYWLPALAEYHLVTWREAILPAPRFQVTWHQLFAFPLLHDPQVILPPLATGLGFGLLLFGGATLFWGVWRPTFSNFHRVFLGTGIFLLGVLILFVPNHTWMMGPATFCLAVGASGVVVVIYGLPQRIKRLAMASSLVAILVSALPLWISNPRAIETGHFTPLEQLEVELKELGWAILPRGALLPSTLPFPVASNRFLLAGYRAEEINRFALNQTDARLRGIFNANSHEFSFQIQILEAGMLDILNASFAGWRAFMDGIPLSIQAHPITGLMQVHLPNRNIPLPTITIQLGPTPIRTYAWLLSGLTLALVFAHTWSRLWQREMRFTPTNHLDKAEVRLFSFTISLFFMAFLALNFTPLGNYFRPAPRYQLVGAQFLTRFTDSGLQPIAYRLDATEIKAGDRLNITIYWQTLIPLRHNYWIQLYLEDVTSGDKWFLSDAQLLGDFPTIRWPRNQYKDHRATLTTSINAVSGEYRIALEVFSCDAGCNSSTPVTFFDANGSALGHTLYLPDKVYIRR